MSDFEYQANYIKQNANRIIWMQDRHPLSPSYGCFHYSHWRDKVSEFADIRFQEAGAALALLAHPLLHEPSLPMKEALYKAFSAGVVFWNRQQHSDGSFDEWYKNEHGFAATTFSLIAYGLAIYFLADKIEQEDKKILLQTAEKAANWLLKHDDFVKMNHQAAGAAALAIAYKICGKEAFLNEAVRKHQTVLKAQTDEGWFNEIAGMDLGYCSVLLDYMMLYHYITKDNSGLEAMKKLYAFIFPFIQPDITISPEAGICLNPYVSRLGTLLLSEHSPEAASVAKAMDSQSAGFSGIEPYLADDLRLCRWGYLPLITYIIREQMKAEFRFAKACNVQVINSEGAAFYEQAGVFSYKSKGLHCIFMPAGGGGIRIFYQGNNSVDIYSYEDLGYFYDDPSWTKYKMFTGGYKNTRKIEKDSNTVTAYIRFAPAKFFFPPFIARLILRIGCSIPYLSYWLRWLIDVYRKKKGTAINQSVAPLSEKSLGIILKRRLIMEGSTLKITDEIACENNSFRLNLRHLHPLIFSSKGIAEPPGLFDSLGTDKVESVIITKEIRTSDKGFSFSFSAKGK